VGVLCVLRARARGGVAFFFIQLLHLLIGAAGLSDATG
jgi:hypothetical protein